MTIETTITTTPNTEAHQSADFWKEFPRELELANPWTISDDELREIATRATSAKARAYIAGVLAGRAQVRLGTAEMSADPMTALAQARSTFSRATEAARREYKAALDCGDRAMAEQILFRMHRLESASFRLSMIDIGPAGVRE